MKSLWKKWKVLSAKILDKEATIVLTFLYFVLITPFALAFKILADPLNMESNNKSFWFEKDSSNSSSLSALKKQY